MRDEKQDGNYYSHRFKILVHGGFSQQASRVNKPSKTAGQGQHAPLVKKVRQRKLHRKLERVLHVSGGTRFEDLGGSENWNPLLTFFLVAVGCNVDARSSDLNGLFKNLRVCVMP